MVIAAPTIAQLRAFVAVGRLRHFGEAATQLRVSQPTLSQALSTLEANLGVQLIERSPRMVLVTPAGERLLPLAEAAIAAVDAVADAVEPVRWLTGPLSIGIIPTIAPYLLPAMLRTLRREAPDLQLSVREDQTWRLVDSLRRGELDLTVLALPIREPGLVELPVYDEEFVLAVPAKDDLAGSTDLAPAVLAGQRLLLLEEGHCLRDQALEVCVQAGVGDVGHDAARASSLATVVQLVAAGMGATLLPATAIPVESRGATIGIGTFAAPAPGRRIGLVYRSTSSRAEEFGDLAEIVRRAITKAKLPARPAYASQAASLSPGEHSSVSASPSDVPGPMDVAG